MLKDTGHHRGVRTSKNKTLSLSLSLSFLCLSVRHGSFAFPPRRGSAATPSHKQRDRKLLRTLWKSAGGGRRSRRGGADDDDDDDDDAGGEEESRFAGD